MKTITRVKRKYVRRPRKPRPPLKCPNCGFLAGRYGTRSGHQDRMAAHLLEQRRCRDACCESLDMLLRVGGRTLVIILGLHVTVDDGNRPWIRGVTPDGVLVDVLSYWTHKEAQHEITRLQRGLDVDGAKEKK